MSLCSMMKWGGMLLPELRHHMFLIPKCIDLEDFVAFTYDTLIRHIVGMVELTLVEMWIERRKVVS